MTVSLVPQLTMASAANAERALCFRAWTFNDWPDMTVDPAMFANASLRALWVALLPCRETGQQAPQWYATELCTKLGLEKGEFTRLLDMMQTCEPAASANWFADRVVDAHKRRQLQLAAEMTLGAVADPSTSVNNLARNLAEECEVTQQVGRHAVPSIAASVTSLLDEWEQPKPADKHAVLTGIPAIDAEGGLLPSWLILIVARPGEGKTAFALNNMVVDTCKAGGACLVFSIEMSTKELVKRCISAESAVPVNHQGHREDVKADDYVKATSAGYHVGGWPLYVVDDADVSIDDIRSIARAQHAHTPLTLIVVDYVQLIENNTVDERASLQRTSRGLKKMAKELDCVVVMLSQPTVKAERDTVPLRGSDCRGSQCFNADADQAYVPDWPKIRDENADPREVRLLRTKNRHGTQATFDGLRFNGARMRIEPVRGAW